MKKATKGFMKGVLAVIMLLPGAQLSYGQYAYFVESGKIEFEKRVNMFAKIEARVTDDNISMQKVYEDYRRTQPQFITTRTSLSFNKKQSLYEIVAEAGPTSAFIDREPWVIANNTVLTNFILDSVTTVKKVFGVDFVVRDKQPDILWKHTNEVREIAGYKCKRANGLIQDSIYVVAFYTEQIVPTVGPESFSGLPGMILGVALPHENVTWFATQVLTDSPDPIKAPAISKKAEEVSRKALEEYLKQNLKNWGTYGDEALKAFLLLTELHELFLPVDS